VCHKRLMFREKLPIKTVNLFPVPSVVVKGKDKGTATDFDGKYNIQVNVGDVLKFSSLGYNSVEKKVTGAGTIDVVLKEATDQLDKVVVTAMGVKEKSTCPWLRLGNKLRLMTSNKPVKTL